MYNLNSEQYIVEMITKDELRRKCEAEIYKMHQIAIKDNQQYGQKQNVKEKGDEHNHPRRKYYHG